MTLAIYPGTFDPMTLGHEDVVRRAYQLFGNVIVAVAEGHHKKTMFSLEERLEMARALAMQPQILMLDEPSSPLGQIETVWPDWEQPLPASAARRSWRVLDSAYRPLWLEGHAPERQWDALWQLWTPNKALGMTGVRAAYAIAPRHTEAAETQALAELAPSWVVGAHGVAMLQAWLSDEVQLWLTHSLQTLRDWKAQQLALCERLGWAVVPGHQANYFVARLPVAEAVMSERLSALRAQGIKLRDCRSFGLPGHVRLGVLPPASQAALEQAWHDLEQGALAAAKGAARAV